MSASRRSWPLHCRAALVAAIDAAAEQFPGSGEDEARRIHDVRKTLKRAAGLARLFQPLVGAPADAARAALDAARRSVGRARDLDILPGVLARMNAPAKAREVLLKAIGAQRDAERRAHKALDVDAVAAELSALARSVEGWRVETAGAAPLLAAVRSAYRAAQRRGQRALASRVPAELHTLRARVVDLSYQLATLEPAWPEMIATFNRELHRLRQTLGEHNDLTVLAEFVHKRPELTGGEAEALLALIARRRRPLERRADERFARLFAERPSAFERRLAAYLERPQRKPGPPAVAAKRPAKAREARGPQAAATRPARPRAHPPGLTTRPGAD
jgi:CHAD domain-containing protein